jgi:uncharacterized membrane protein YdjX (TVP38/TMEM64 family)
MLHEQSAPQHSDTHLSLTLPRHPHHHSPNHHRDKRLRRVAGWAVVGLIVAFLVFLNIYYRNLYLELYRITEDIINQRNAFTYLNIFFINVLLQMCFVPGISFFIMFIGFICKDYWYAISLVIPSTLLVCALTYLITRYTIRDYLEEKLSHKWYFKMFYVESAKRPWKTSFMLRFILIPVTYKNYLIALMNINFVQFLVPCGFFFWPYFSSYVFIGMTVRSAQDIINGKISEAEKKVLFMYIAIYVVFIVLSGVFCGYLIRMTCRLRQQYKEEAKREKLLAQEAETLAAGN